VNRPSSQSPRVIHSPPLLPAVHCLGLVTLSAYVIALTLSFGDNCAIAQTWSPAINAHPQEIVDDNFPQIAFMPDGTKWVVWMSVDPVEGDEEILSSRWNGTEWGSAIRVNPANQNADRLPVINCSADGTLWTYWSAFDPRSPGTYLGLVSRWDGFAWMWPETLWTGADRHDDADIAGIDSTEVWAIRHFASGSGDADVTIYHLNDHAVQSQTFTDPDSVDYVPSIAAGIDGSVWAAWMKIPDPPSNSRVAYTRYVSGAWETPKSLPEPRGIIRVGVTVDRSLKPWIIASASDPVHGIYSNAVWALRWGESAWLPPVRISNPYASVDTTSGFHMSVSKSPREYPAAVWLLENIYSSTRHDIEMSFWDGTAWSGQVTVGDVADSALVGWPRIDRLGATFCVAYMRPVPPSYVSNVFTTSTTRVPTAAQSLAFTIDDQTVPLTITWKASGLRGPAFVRLFRAPGSWADPVSPGSSMLVDSVFEDQLEGGTGVVRDTTPSGDPCTYWLSVEGSFGTLWAGPQTSPGHRMASSIAALSRISPNPGSSRIHVYGRVVTSQRSTIDVVDISGRLIKRIAVTGIATHHEDSELGGWDATDTRGRRVPSGIYMLRIRSGTTQSNSIRVVLLR
jgi:hypothetical protein